MPRIPKLETLDQLREHIDAHATQTGSGFTFDKFEQAMEFKLSALKMQQLAHCNYTTIRKWMGIYKVEQLSKS